MSDGDSGNEGQPYEQQTNGRYTQFSNFRDILPPFIWQELIGITPQKRRAYLLQTKFLTPLTFDYALLQFFSQFAVNIFTLHFVSAFWQLIGKNDPILFFLLVSGFGAGYAMFKWSQSKNTVTIREEIIFRSLVDTLSLTFAIAVTFDLSIYTQMIKGWFN